MDLPILNHALIHSGPCHGLDRKTLDHLRTLPEKVLQFGTGVLLRGLPDYYIDRANKLGLFNGRIVVVKTTSQGNTADFEKQDCLFTHVVNGLRDGKPVRETGVNCSISRVLEARGQWPALLDCAADPALELVISNTTERGIVYAEERISERAPESFPGKLLALLHHRFLKLGKGPGTGLTIVPTELIEGNGERLKEFILRGASHNQLGQDFEDWIREANTFCNSLVDRIVPGKPEPEKTAAYYMEWGYRDENALESEPYDLWAIEGEAARLPALSFAACNPGIRIETDIARYKELKLRLLNGTHILSCGKAILESFRTVREGFADPVFLNWAEALMDEISASIPLPIEEEARQLYAESVLQRFKNPFIEHQWESILLNYSSKVKIRVLPLLTTYYQRKGNLPGHIAEGFASYLALSIPDEEENGQYFKWAGGRRMRLQDELSPLLYQDFHSVGFAATVKKHLHNSVFWGFSLETLPGFSEKALELAVKLNPGRQIV
ncbi:MAG: hypothetical protein RL386_704 [Bacteroidota bacterium]|jgi:tagaturonate reductase